MKKVVVLLVIFFGYYAFGQESPQLPSIIPPSPEAASLMKAGNTSTSMHTGAASVSIPVYELEAGSLKVPISVDYFSNGIKVDDIPTRVGLGWNLNAGGMISRTIYDEPDGVWDSIAAPADLLTHNQTLLDYLTSTTGIGNFDTQPDVYSYNFPGGSGKFFIDSIGIARCIPHNNFKVAVTGTPSERSFNITTPDGTVYYFGDLDAVEKTSSLTLMDNIEKGYAYETGWYLTKIKSLNGDQVVFTYNHLAIKTRQGPFQTMIKPFIPLDQGNTYCENGNVTCEYSQSTGINAVNYNTVSLSSIESNDGKRVDFIHSNRPDSSGDTRLQYINISAGTLITGFTLVKRVGLDYDDNAVNTIASNGFSGTLNKRYFLKKIKMISSDAADSSLNYTFDYIDQMGMAPRLSFGQDYFGYSNGMGNSLYFAPIYNDPSSSNSSIGANRTSNGSYGQKGLLQKVNYPTGGYEEFEYEPNTISVSELVNTNHLLSLTGNGAGTNSPLVQTRNTYLIKRSQTANLNISAFEHPGFPGSPAPNGVDKIVQVRVLNGTTPVATYNVYTYSLTDYTIPLNININYTVELTIWGQVHAATATLIYDTAAAPVYAWINKDVGGLRVKKIADFDPVSNKTNNRYYKYAAMSDLSKSSGSGVTQTDFVKVYTTGHLCHWGMGATILTCRNFMVSSSSLFPYFSHNGSHVAYTNVVESDDPDFKNGGTEHFFTTYATATINEQIMGQSVQGLPSGITTDQNGTEWKTVVFKKPGSQLIPLRETRNVYSFDSRINNTRYGYIIRRRWAGAAHFIPPMELEFDGYDLNRYYYRSSWPHLDTTIATEYDQNGQNPLTVRTIYTYANTNHLSATKIETYNSKNELLKTEIKYPQDFVSGSNVYNTLVQKNAIALPIEQLSYKGASTLLYSTKTEYKDWFSNQQILAPEYVNTKKSTSTAEPRIRYHVYDTDGNPLVVSKELGAKISYIWDYYNSLPIAEIKNAGIKTDSLAYTSFEADGKGYWVFSGAKVSETSAPMGGFAYNLTSGNITRSIQSSKSYYVTYWLKDASGTVSVNGTASKLLIGRNGWTCYQHTIQSSSLVTVSGTGRIDELRLYPVGSYMTTFTHQPLVGLSSRNEPNNQITYYEYDGFKRMKLLRDGDRNIVKQLAYAYAQNITPCTNSTANWVATSIVRCKPSGANNNYTGEKEKEEKDMNNCSPTYLQTRWVSLGTAPECAPIPNCTGENKRVVNGVCETSPKIFIYQINLGNGQWDCKYYYQWSDGYRSPDYIGSDSSVCLEEI